MALKEKTKSKLIKKLKEFEGNVPHLYLDSVGFVTVGIGHLIADREKMSGVIMYTVKDNLPSTLATLEEKKAEFDTIKSETKNRLASYYKSKTTLIMKQEDIIAQKEKHIETFYNSLKQRYKITTGYKNNFDDFPEEVKLALLDMVFNLGPTKLRTQFTSFNSAIIAEDWQRAASESNRPQLSASRNAYVRNLFISAAMSKITPRLKPERPIVMPRMKPAQLDVNP